MRLLKALALAGLLWCSHAQAQNAQVVTNCGTAGYTANQGQKATTQDAGGNRCAVTAPFATTFQGTMTLGAATSTTLTSGNVTMASSTVLPTTFGVLKVVNTGANPVFACWFGGTASATSGCESIAAGGTDTVFLANFATAPTFFSTAGTTLAFRN